MSHINVQGDSSSARYGIFAIIINLVQIWSEDEVMTEDLIMEVSLYAKFNDQF